MLAHQEWSANRLAARAVVLHHTGDVAEKRELLDMLGLLGPDGATITPDDHRFNAVSDIGAGGGEAAAGVSSAQRMANLHSAPHRPETFTSPPALRHYLENAAAAEKAAAAAERDAERAARKAASRAPKKGGSDQPAAPPRVLTPGGAVCGSLGGRRKHIRRGEPVCADCREAYRIWQRAYLARRRAANGLPTGPLRPPAECGTPAGRKRHYREKTPVCEPCLEAARADGRKHYHAAQARKRAQRDEQQAS